MFRRTFRVDADHEFRNPIVTAVITIALVRPEPVSIISTQSAAAVSGEVKRMIAAAINAHPRWFWHGPDAGPVG